MRTNDKTGNPEDNLMDKEERCSLKDDCQMATKFHKVAPPKNETKKIDRCHLIYTIVIAVIILASCVISIRYTVAEEAFSHFSFAATITSIVLAVVSIIYTIQSGIVTLNQRNGMIDIEERISSRLRNLEDIEKRIEKLADKIDKNFDSIKTDPLGSADNSNKGHDENPVNPSK